MKIQIDTESQRDRKMMRKLLDLFEAEGVPPPIGFHAEPEQTKTVKPTNAKEAVLDAIRKTGGLANVAEISVKYPKYALGTIRATLWTLAQERKVEKNTAYPPSYFIRKVGNPELSQMFPPGTKTSVMR